MHIFEQFWTFGALLFTRFWQLIRTRNTHFFHDCNFIYPCKITNVCKILEPTANGNTLKIMQTHVTFSGFSTTKKRTFSTLEVGELGFLVDKTDFSISWKKHVFHEKLSLIFCEILLSFCIFYESHELITCKIVWFATENHDFYVAWKPLKFSEISAFCWHILLFLRVFLQIILTRFGGILITKSHS